MVSIWCRISTECKKCTALNTFFACFDQTCSRLPGCGDKCFKATFCDTAEKHRWVWGCHCTGPIFHTRLALSRMQWALAQAPTCLKRNRSRRPRSGSPRLVARFDGVIDTRSALGDHRFFGLFGGGGSDWHGVRNRFSRSMLGGLLGAVCSPNRPMSMKRNLLGSDTLWNLSVS